MAEIINRVYLRGVDLVSLTSSYLNNEFVQMERAAPVTKEKISINDDPVAMKVYDGSYQLDLGGCGRSFACIGHIVSTEDGRYGILDPEKEYNCMYCLRKIEGNPIGIPIRRDELNEKVYYHMVDAFCTFNCCLAELKGRYQNHTYAQSLVYLNEIYYKCFGERTLRPASDHRLLKIWNGPMSWEEFHQSHNVYEHKSSNMVFLPVLEYLEQS